MFSLPKQGLSRFCYWASGCSRDRRAPCSEIILQRDFLDDFPASLKQRRLDFGLDWDPIEGWWPPSYTASVWSWILGIVWKAFGMTRDHVRKRRLHTTTTSRTHKHDYKDRWCSGNAYLKASNRVSCRWYNELPIENIRWETMFVQAGSQFPNSQFNFRLLRLFTQWILHKKTTTMQLRIDQVMCQATDLSISLFPKTVLHKSTWIHDVFQHHRFASTI